jgi:hypothetical protein
MTTVSDPVELLALANPVPPGSLSALAAERADGLLATLRAELVEPRPRLGRGLWWGRPAFARRAVRVATALAVIAILTTGVAWAAGAFNSPTPQSLFRTNFPADTGSGPIFQNVVPDSVKQVASVEIPKVGPVALWHALTKQGGWCLGLRLSNGSWLGTPPQAGGSPLDGGGAVPGCFPTGVIDPGGDHLEWLENDIDARSVGGTFWRIRSGVITVPGAVKVTDLTTGKSTDVVDGNVFILAIEAPNPAIPGDNSPRLHLVAYDRAGKVIASDCRSCAGG